MFRVDALIKKLSWSAWQKLSAGTGAEGNRFYEWALADLADDRLGHHQLLVRRSRRASELAFYRCCSASSVPAVHPVCVAGRGWTVEETFESGEGPGRTGRTPGQTLDVLAPLGHPRDARPRLPQSSAPADTPATRSRTG